MSTHRLIVAVLAGRPRGHADQGGVATAAPSAPAMKRSRRSIVCSSMSASRRSPAVAGGR
ncbi:hypothetical protein ACFQZ4_40760 [Catellatospora coxensis]